MWFAHGPKVESGSLRFVLAAGPRFRAQNKHSKAWKALVENGAGRSARLAANDKE
jgi:hypothetical protein